MGAKTEIAWTDSSWNPVRGCSRVSEGCRHCYAEGASARFSGPGLPYEGLAKRVNGEARWTNVVRCIPEALPLPLHWKKPRRIFVNSMSDLFHEQVPFEFIDQVFAVMALCPQHTFQILTKRPERMLEYMRDRDWCDAANYITDLHIRPLERGLYLGGELVPPLPNVWLGTSVENQEVANERVLQLVQTPAVVRFLSCEPLLGPLNLGLLGTLPRDVSKSYSILADTLHWVIIGGESGPGARPCNLGWIREIKSECSEAGVACFVKQLGSVPVIDESLWRGSGMLILNHRNHLKAPDGTVPLLFNDPKGGDTDEWPGYLLAREFPEVRA